LHAKIKVPTPIIATGTTHQGKNSWSSNRTHQAALEFIDAWLAQADLADDLVTLSNQTMMAVLEPDAETLVQKTQSKIWCP